MIIEAIIKTLLQAVKIIFLSIKTLFPAISVPIQFGYTIIKITEITTQANNFIYFIMGDTAYILLPLIILLLTYKYLVYPIANIMIGIFVNKQG